PVVPLVAEDGLIVEEHRVVAESVENRVRERRLAVGPLAEVEEHNVVLGRETERTLPHAELEPLLDPRGERPPGSVPQLVTSRGVVGDVGGLRNEVRRIVTT